MILRYLELDVIKLMYIVFFYIWVYGQGVMPKFNWLCDVCGCVMSSTSGIYWVELDFIYNCKASQLLLVLLRYNTDVASANVTNVFPWFVTQGPRPIGPRNLAWRPSTSPRPR